MTFKSLQSPATIIGYGCRLPGAESPDAFWRLLEDRRCTVTEAPRGRWQASRFVHPRASEPGYTYTAAGGYLDDPLSFDAAAFGISPREAQQMDPQQRLLLEVVWEALEDAGLPPSTLAGKDVGVYVGASNVDYQSTASLDLASIESHFMTGNSLSITANRISHVFDWRGPSMTIDTACSSSLVALAQAMSDLDRGLVDTAVVAGVNLLLSPAPYVGFSRARMLSPTGRCRPFSAEADGYVRSEGAVAFVLRRPDVPGTLRSRGTIVSAGVNSDGRTVGISLPSIEGQRALLDRLYGEASLDVDSIAFVEAHGTGTRVGDPAEAGAIGAALGRRRTLPLPVGSAKSNVGHLESASGAVGLLKAVQSLERGVFPPTLHLDRLNPDIDFESLNLVPATQSIPVAVGSKSHAGICNYGFGGTNAHVIIRGVDRAVAQHTISDPRLLMLSARSSEALAELASRCAGALREAQVSPALLGSGMAHQREPMQVRAAFPMADTAGVLASLDAIGKNRPALVARGVAASRSGQLAFVYSGNGSQWNRMGRAALLRSPNFLHHMREIDRQFVPEAGWSLEARLNATTLSDDLALTSTAQPLIFAIQVALTRSLADLGMTPRLVLGHSIGEIAAAWAAGALDLPDALRLILVRSRQQEASRDRGRMAVLACGEAAAREILSQAAPDTVDLAAFNGPNSTTISGTEDGVRATLATARARRVAALQLDLRYPFHSSLLDGEREAVLSGLEGLPLRPSRIPFVSTVTGAALDGENLGPDYWWRNVRDPVRFQQAIESAAATGADLFVEVGPRPLLTGAIGDTLNRLGIPGTVVASFSETDEATEGDPVLAVAARLAAHGAQPDNHVLFGHPPAWAVDLPSYPWQRQRYVLPRTTEALGTFGEAFGGTPPHPLLGYRMAAGSPEWRTCIDAATVPFLADHRVGEETVVPGSVLLEMVLTVARTVWTDGPLVLEDFDILHPLSLPSDGMREVSTTFSAVTSHVEIRSRARLGGDDWTRHARVRVGRKEGRPSGVLPLLGPTATDHGAEELYRCTAMHGLNYGPAFRLVEHVRRDGNTSYVDLVPPLGQDDDLPFLLDPRSTDAALHPFFLEWANPDDRPTAHLPVRLKRVTLWADRPHIARAVLQRVSEVGRTSVGCVTLMDAAGSVVATVEDVVFRSVPVGRSRDERVVRVEWQTALWQGTKEQSATAPSIPSRSVLSPGTRARSEGAWRLVQGFALALAWRLARQGLARRAPGTERFMAQLVANGLAEQSPTGWRIKDEGPLHEPEAILQALAALHPEANAEIVLCTNALSRLSAVLDGEEAGVPRGVREHVEADSMRIAPAAEMLATLAADWCRGRAGTPPTILVCAPWHGALLKALVPLASSGRARFALAGHDPAKFDEAVSRWTLPPGFSFAHLAGEGRAKVCALALKLTLGRTEHDEDMSSLTALLTPGASWLEAVADPDIALSLLLDSLPGSASSRAAALRGAGLDEANVTAGPAGWSLLTSARSWQPASSSQVIAIGTGADAFGQELAEQLFGQADGREDWTIIDGDYMLPALEDRAGGRLTLVEFAGLSLPVDPGTRLRDHLMRMRDTLLRAQQAGGDVRIWLLTRGAHARLPDPHAAAAWAFGRVVANEHPAIDVRRIDLDPGLAPAEAAQRLLQVMEQPGQEMEFVLRQEHMAFSRLLPGRTSSARAPDEGERTVLTVPTSGKLADGRWLIEARRAPGLGEIEIAVDATGLNFRDVMLGMGFLDEDLLGGGLSEAALGFELAGTVVAVGPGVEDFRPGDAAMGFAAGAFASHVTVPAAALVPVPQALSVEAAATIPVAFATAWYALEEVARLQPGETVLIHGGAGGVGLAAIQIARARGARILATAGSPDRRTLVRLMGADAVFDSRSLAFADKVRAEGGADVVLNSLAGEAMLQGLRILRPFGRFIELGKRDYLENTSVDIRPLLRNVAYHNVDLDQFLAARPEQAARVLREVSAGLADGRFGPLPYRVFEGEAAVQAFRLMQASGHVGKILVRPAGKGSVRPPRPAPFVAPSGPILVVGGTMGFGFETACWLAGQGARTLVLGSRRGAVPADLQSRLDALRAIGVTVDVCAVDATDAAAVQRFVEGAVTRHGPIVGAIHTAMFLADGLIAGMAEAEIDSVLAPKVSGILALERALADQPLAFFVAYSSAATLVGNPGQGAYVAANAFMEGVMQRRRAEGLPGLAVAWGAIGGAGVLRDRAELEQRLQRTTGLSAIPVEQALSYLGDLLTRGTEAEAVAYVTEIAGAEAAERLPVLRSPTFEPLLGRVGKVRRSVPAGDFIRRVRSADPAEALQIVMTMLAEEVGSILQLPAERIEPLRPLNEIGMDSLMALELRTQVEKRCHIDLPMVSVAGRGLRDLAERLLGDMRVGETAGGSMPPHTATTPLEDLQRQHTNAALPVAPRLLGQGLEETVEQARVRKGVLL